MPAAAASTVALVNSAKPATFSIAHVTHEAVEKMGGIGTVLEGMMTSRVYQAAVKRSILVGPMGGHHYESPLRRLGPQVTVKYSSIDGIDMEGLGRLFHPVEWAFGVRIAYGVRRYPANAAGAGGVAGEAEVLLIDVSNPAAAPLNAFKHRLWEHYGLDAGRYEGDWGFEEYCRLAEPAFYALNAILGEDDLPCVVFSHEFMGLCTALKTHLDGGEAFRTVFHAHECATARRLCEGHPGHDTAFYNVLRQAARHGKFVADLFGDQSVFMRHALIANAHRLDAIVAVGDPTAEEMRFLNRETRDTRIDLVYNGIPTPHEDYDVKVRSRALLDRWAEAVAGFRPDYLMTHVARPVISKGFWRDLKVAHHLDDWLGERGRSALVLILTCGAPPRSMEVVNRMAREHRWPWRHREGYPDLAGPEVEIYGLVQAFNAGHANVKALLVNQFGWGREFLGEAAPEGMTMQTLRQAADVEFGQSVYEPFGIANLEPLASGAICVSSSVCGCVSACRHTMARVGLGTAECPNLLVADYTRLDEPRTVEALLAMTREERDAVEERVARAVAGELARRLPRDDAQRRALFESGRRLAAHMGWDSVVGEGLLPMLGGILASPKPRPAALPPKPLTAAGEGRS